MRTMLLVLTVVVGCTTSSQPGGGDDVTTRVDAPGHMSVTTDITCAMTEFTEQAPDGSKVVYDSGFFLVDDLHPGDQFAIEVCKDPPPAGACPTGYTCTSTGPTYPTGQQCSIEPPQFAGGNLVISCGYLSTSYNAAGAMTTATDNRYTAVRLHR